jgi:hypothetical protein
MKSIMIFLGLFLVGATALRLENNCIVPRAAHVDCNDSCEVTQDDLKIKHDHILTFTSNHFVQSDQNVITLFDQCLARFVETRAATAPANNYQLLNGWTTNKLSISNQVVRQLDILVRDVAYQSVKNFDEGVQKHVETLTRVEQYKGAIKKVLMNTKSPSDCFLRLDKFADCKKMQQNHTDLQSIQNKIENKYRQSRLQQHIVPNVTTATQGRIQITNAFINEWAMKWVKLPTLLQEVDAEATCNKDCFRLVIAGPDWAPHCSPGRIHGLWYDKESQIDKSQLCHTYHRALDYNQYKAMNTNPVHAGKDRWAIDGFGYMMHYEWMKHGRCQPNRNAGEVAYWEFAERLLDHVNKLEQIWTVGFRRAMTTMSNTDTVFCFQKKNHRMVLVKCVLHQ